MLRKHALLSAAAVAVLVSARVVPFANTLTGLIPDLFAGLDVVSRELVGMIPSVGRDVNAERAAVGELVKWHVAPVPTAVNITPAMAVPEPADQTIGNDSIQITKAKAVPFGFVGEEQKGLNNGPGYLSVQADMFAQSLRVLTNEIETDLCNAAIVAASRATGTPGTTPYASDLGASAQLRKILDDNGAPLTDRSLVINTSTGAALRTLGQLTKANEVGDVMTVRDGQLIDLHGFSIKESNSMLTTMTKGTGASYTSTAAGFAVGTTSIPLITGTGTILAGDVVTFAGDTNKYVVITGIAAPGTIVIAAPGLRQAIPASATALTVGNSYAPNIGFVRSAIQLVARAPALPQEGDLALDRMMLTDPRSGLSFEVSIYPGYRKVRFEVALAWGVKVAKTAHVATLQG